MSIAFSCSGCGVKFKVPESKGGHRSKCPKCGVALIIPTPVLAAARGNGGRSRTLPPDLLTERQYRFRAAAESPPAPHLGATPPPVGPTAFSPPAPTTVEGATLKTRTSLVVGSLLLAGGLLVGIVIGHAAVRGTPGQPSPHGGASPAADLVSHLPRLKAAVDLATLSKSAWSLAVQYPASTYRLMGSAEAAISLSQLRLPADDPEATYLDRYRPQIASLLTNLKYLGRVEAAYLQSDRHPVQIVQTEGQPCLLVTGLALRTVHNSDKLTPKRRASEVVRSNVLPALRDFDTALFKTDLPFFGIVCLFGARNSLEGEGGPAEAEVVCFVTGRQDCHQFITGEISQEELLRRACVFFSDHDSTGSATRIEVTLD